MIGVDIERHTLSATAEELGPAFAAVQGDFARLEAREHANAAEKLGLLSNSVQRGIEMPGRAHDLREEDLERTFTVRPR